MTTGTITYIGKSARVRKLGLEFEPGVPIQCNRANVLRAFKKNPNYFRVQIDGVKPDTVDPVTPAGLDQHGFDDPGTKLDQVAPTPRKRGRPPKVKADDQG